MQTGIILYALSDILIPLAFSLLFYYILQPVVTFLTKVRGNY
jgi:predicted PurR-regulated permease PerM